MPIVTNQDDGVVKNPTNYFAGGRDTTTIAKKSNDQKQFGAPTLVSTRRTWSERTGYNTSEFYVGDRAQMQFAFNDPRFVCGAQQVVMDEDQDSRRATMTIDFSHRSRQEAQANYAQPEEFKDVWTLENQVDNAEIWRHPKYSRLNNIQYAANVQYPLSRLIVLIAQQYEQIFTQAANTQIQETATDLSGTTPAGGFPGVANLTRAFDVWDYIQPHPTGDGAGDIFDLGRCLANNVLKGNLSHPIFRQVVSNQSVVPSNARYGGNIFSWRAGYISTRQLTWVILQNIYGLENARSRTPAGCRPVSAAKWSLIQGLRTWFNDVVWLPYAPTVIELTNGSFEVSRSWVAQFPWEIDPCATDANEFVENTLDPVVDNNGSIVTPSPPAGVLG